MMAVMSKSSKVAAELEPEPEPEPSTKGSILVVTREAGDVFFALLVVVVVVGKGERILAMGNFTWTLFLFFYSLSLWREFYNKFL